MTHDLSNLNKQKQLLEKQILAKKHAILGGKITVELESLWLEKYDEMSLVSRQIHVTKLLIK